MTKIFNELVGTNAQPKSSNKEKILKYLIVLGIIVVIFIGDQFIVSALGYGKG